MALAWIEKQQFEAWNRHLLFKKCSCFVECCLYQLQIDPFFVICISVVGDTCVAMEDWLQNPTANTALDDILPCVDNATAKEIQSVTKNVSFQLVSLVNGVINTATNVDPPPNIGPPVNYNQSGPLVPLLCSRFNSDLTSRTCLANEVQLNEAPAVRDIMLIASSNKYIRHILLLQFFSSIISSRSWNFACRFGRISLVKYQLLAFAPPLVGWHQVSTTKWQQQQTWVMVCIAMVHSWSNLLTVHSFDKYLPISVTTIALVFDYTQNGYMSGWFWCLVLSCSPWSSGLYTQENDDIGFIQSSLFLELQEEKTRETRYQSHILMILH